MNIESREQPNYKAEYVVVVGYFIFFCLALILCLGLFYFVSSQQHSVPINVFATSLPATTPNPHIATTNQQNANTIFEDDFSNNQNEWTRNRDIFKEEVRDGKLYFESRIENDYAFTGCGSCPYLKEPYYLQAELSTDTATDESFGILFNLNHSGNRFFLFQINTEAKKYYYYHNTVDSWSLRAAGESSQIKSFPSSNILGIYVNQDVVELYINGEIVDSYNESGYSFPDGYFSFYVDDWGFKLVVDNLIINEVRK